MGLIAYLYKKKFVCRYDKEVGVPYYSHLDFNGLKQESYSFVNSKGIEIKYFYYYYDNYKQDKLILFLHGLGPGHCAYIAEIEQFAKRGYKVLTLDYTGCGESKGKLMKSLNTPTRDTMELLDYLKLDKEIIVSGHSLGGYTGINILNLRKEISKAVLIAPFLLGELEIQALIKKPILVKGILKYERKYDPEYYDLNNIEFLKNTTKNLLFIHSNTDVMVPTNTSYDKVVELNNPNIKTILIKDRKHNPNYTDAAVNYMNEVFGTYQYLLKQRKIKTDQEKIDYFKDVSLSKLVEQDEKLFDQIDDFINKK